MKIYGIDILDPDSNRFDGIYSVDLGVDNNEWVSSFLLEQNLAIKVSCIIFFVYFFETKRDWVGKN